MDSENFSAAVREWRKALGNDAVLTDAASLERYAQNVGGVKRTIPAILRPASTDEVQHVVAIANRRRIPLHPVSIGKNWGLGSRLPVRDDIVVVDLSRMNRIHEVNVPGHYAVIEPGVTQRQLVDHLREKQLPIMLNVTGSALDTSLLGNALDRGIGYFASRAESLSNLEVVLGNGKVIRTGFGHFAGARTANLYRFGVGPYLDGLFAQSNFGIVTCATFDLMPRRETHMAVIALIDVLAELRRRDILQTVVHVGNRYRTQITMAPLVYERLREGVGAGDGDGALRMRAEKLIEAEGFGPWSAVGGLRGTHGQLREARREIRRALRGLARTMFLTDALVGAAKRLGALFRFIPWVRKKEAMLLAVEPLYGLAKGVPTDEPMKSVYWPVGEMPKSPNEDPDQSRCGLLYCVPFLPARGDVVEEAMNHTERVYRKYGFDPAITLNLVDGKSIECVISVAFDRSRPEQVAAAHACNDELTETLTHQGFIPYRVGVQSMSAILNEDDPFWQTVRDLKKVLDPNHIISPGHYNLL